jgi:TolB-like protein/two-component SAPR family response regulator
MSQLAEHFGEARSYEFGPFRVDAANRLLLRTGVIVPLTSKVFDILLVFVQNSGRLLDKDDLMREVWPDSFVEEGNLARNVSTLRKALGASPNEHQYIVTVPGRGYRFVARVKESNGAALDEFTSAESAEEKFKVSSIAVMPFVNVGSDPDTEYLAEGITESLINQLSRLPNLKVKSRNSVFRYKGRETDAQTVGRELGVRAVLMGRIVQRGEIMSVSIELVDARDNSHLWGEQYERKLADVLLVQREITQKITERLRLQLTDSERQLVNNHYTESAEAYQLYVKGRYLLNKWSEPDLKKAVEYFEQAITVDPTYAQAYSGLADCYTSMSGAGLLPPSESMPKAEAAVVKALQIDDSLAEAHNSFGIVRHQYYWDWVAAEREFKRAIELNPTYAEAHRYYAIFLGTVGRLDEAIAETERAQQLDPISLSIGYQLGWYLRMAGRYDEAITQFRRLIELDATSVDAYFEMALAYEQKRMFAEAITSYTQRLLLTDQPELAAAFEKVYAVSGYDAAINLLYQELNNISDAARKRGEYVSGDYQIINYAHLGDKDRTFESLEQAYKERHPIVLSLKVNRDFEFLRTDARFADLVQRIGLP